MSARQTTPANNAAHVLNSAHSQPLKHEDTKLHMSQALPVSAELNQLASAVVDSAYKVHRALGPGLLESVYEKCLQHELTKRGFHVQTQVQLPVEYDGLKLELGLRLDMLVNDCLIIEVKAVDMLAEIHQAQLLTYLRLTGHRLGFLINFNVPTIKSGIKRMVL